ncbi:ABC transporter ATP-binding protein [Verrucomicrobiaceae bacterium N1E253]|uniref:ABC transporter ATP-binding protein n=1 Tax=Oceaniferula marina TaxID=2748318 RepID=A0A851GNA6_9BACT|nr:ABC transporter ATP-binding protein [Oceaniferula marina]NWK56615.1 ABC transporter ATP-binding protein [Oceaniferula marina]
MKRFFPYYKYLLEVKWLFAIAVAAGIAYGAVAGAGLPLVMREVLPGVFSHDQRPLADLIFAALLLPAIYLVQGVAQFTNTYLINYCGFRVVESIQVKVFSRVQKLPLSFFHKNKSGDLLSRLTVDTQQMRMAIVDVSNDIVVQPMKLIGAVGALVYMSMQKSEFFVLLVCLATVPACVFPIRAIGKKLFRKAKVVQAQTGDLTASVTDGLQAPMEIRAYNMQDSVVSRFRQQVNRLLVARMKVVKYDKSMTPVIDFITVCGAAAAIVYAGHSGMEFKKDVVPLLTALYLSYDPLKRLGKIHTKIQRATASLDRVEYVLHHENDLQEPDKPQPFADVKGAVQLEQVSFAYDKECVLRDLNLSIPAGQVVAIVGPSGAGKSSFASLIPRFYDVTQGRITVDGVDVREVEKHDLREAIAIVTQSPVLFNETVMENIRIGKPEASDEDVIEAAQKAHAHEFIETLDGGLGYETPVGERGTLLSGGQRQRIAIARAFLKDAPVLILDEATSALDSESEAAIQQALEELVEGRTTFIIAHRFSTIKIADRILVLNHGRLVADGSHEEIYPTSALYRDLYDRQSG